MQVSSVLASLVYFSQGLGYLISNHTNIDQERVSLQQSIRLPFYKQTGQKESKSVQKEKLSSHCVEVVTTLNTLIPDEDEGRPAPTSSLMGKPPSATATATTGLGVTAYAPSSSSISPSPALGPQPTQGPGYTWLAKLHSGRAAAAGVAGPAPPHQLPSSSAAFAAGVSQPHHQRSQSPYNGEQQGSG